MNHKTTIENISMCFDSEFEIKKIQKQYKVNIFQGAYDNETSSQTGDESYFCTVSGEYVDIYKFMEVFYHFGIL